MCRKVPHMYKLVDPQNLEPAPSTLEEFIDMIRDHHKRNPGARFGSKKQGICTNSCNNIIKPQYRARISLRTAGHHAFRLCDEVKRRMELGFDDFSSEQWQAHNLFKSLVEDKSDKALLKRLGKTDGRQVSQDEMKLLIKTFSTIFFPTTPSDVQMELDFQWEDWRNTPGEIGLYCTNGTDMPWISMCAFNVDKEVPSYGHLNGLAMDRLSTILHEIVHAYLDRYACHCIGVFGSFEESVNQLSGHAWAWQRITSSVERAAPDLTGLPISLERFRIIQGCGDKFRYWPTQQEVKDWQL